MGYLYKNEIRRSLLAVGAVLVFLILFIALIPADASYAESYTTEKFDVHIKVNKNMTYDYTEHIAVNFTERKHGIYRNIPLSTEYKIKNIKVKGADHSLDSESNNRVIIIGSEYRTVYGHQEYVIKYTIAGYDDKMSKRIGKDRLYIDLLPPNWPTTIDKAHVTVEFPHDMDLSKMNTYAASYGGKSVEYGNFKIDNKNHRLTYDAEYLPGYTGATIFTYLPAHYWKGAPKKGIFVTLIVLIAGIYIIFLRLTHGRDPKVIKTVEFNPPDKIPPVEVGYITDGFVDDKDIVSTIFYLAAKGYIDIKEESRKKFNFILKKPVNDENPAVVTFFNYMFSARSSKSGNAKVGDTASMEEVGERLSNSKDTIRGNVESEFCGEKEIFTKKSKTADTISKAAFFVVNFCVCMANMYYKGLFVFDIYKLFWIGIIGLIYATVITTALYFMVRVYYYRFSRKYTGTAWRFALCLIIYAIVCLVSAYLTAFGDKGIGNVMFIAVYLIFLAASPIFICGMRSRSEYGAALLGKVLGFKDFIAAAELEKLKMLVEENPDYFYDILPYAYVFGLTDKWAKKFESIAMEPPKWYSSYDGNYTGTGIMNFIILDSIMSGISHNVISGMNVTDTGDGGGFGSGFGGGGFSGGGFGGGGGGSW